MNSTTRGRSMCRLAMRGEAEAHANPRPALFGSRAGSCRDETGRGKKTTGGRDRQGPSKLGGRVRRGYESSPFLKTLFGNLPHTTSQRLSKYLGQ